MAGAPDAGLLTGYLAETNLALGAVHVLGADAVAPQVCHGRPLSDPDRAVLAAAAALVSPDPADLITAWRRWSLRHRADAVTPATPPAPMSYHDGWTAWSRPLPALAALALPGVDTPLHAAVRARPDELARATTRAVLRRDYPTAAALVRWLARLRLDGVHAPLDLPLLVTHLRLTGAPDGRAGLDLTIADHLLERAR